MIKYLVISLFALCFASSVLAQPNKPLKVGDKAPDFVLENTLGENISLKRHLESGFVILTWYRGSWCPYCNIALVELQEHLKDFKELGAELIAISPQRADSTLTLQQKKELQFTLVSDTDNRVASKYGLSFKLDSERQKLYEERISLSKYNGNNEGTLPITATYIIDSNGIIRYAYVNEDYKKRVNPKDLLKFLKTQNKKQRIDYEAQ
ncbi:MAG: peroxiredoxin-like family protein [Bacteroidales bacterium]